MSEPLQPQPQATDFSFLTNGSQTQLPTNGAGIEKHEELTPVSPAPLHVADASTIPVLKNQMDPGLNTTSLGPFSQDDDDSEDESDDREGSYDPESVAVQDSFQAPIPPRTEGPTINSPNAVSHPPNGFATAAPASTGLPRLKTNPSVEPSNGASSNMELNAASSTGDKPKPSMPNIDLQGLLARLSPTTAQQLPSSSTAPSKELNPSLTTTTPTTSSLPSPPPSLPKPPIPTTHPLPAPVHVPATAVKNPLVRSGLPPSLPNPATFQQPKHPVPSSPHSASEDSDERPFSVEEEEAWERFERDEREYVSKGQWDRFPIGSRLFIGNLPSEKVTKRDIFRIFSRHGRLAQISIKQAYGFVQFLDVSSCVSALRDEQGASCKGRKMHLEVSKPQGKSRDNQSQRQARRSRSPDYRQVGSPRRGSPRGGSHYSGGNDRSYRPGRDGRDHRDRDRDRDWDDFEGRRSPLGRYPRGRDDYRPSRDRSRTPPARYRSRTPEDIPLPRRAPGEVPEVQVIVTDELDRNFLWFVEKAFRDRMVRVDTLFLNPRLDIGAVVRRQILEGVQAVVFLNKKMQMDGKINLQVFDRRQGEANVRFDEYTALDPQVACELVIRARQTHAAPPAQPQYTYGYSAAPVQTPQAPNPTAALLAQALAAQQQPGGNSNLMSLISSLDAPTLQKLLATLQQQQQQPNPLAPPQVQQYPQPHMSQAQPQMTPDLAALLAGRTNGATSQQVQGAYGAPGMNLAGMYGQQLGQPQQHPQHQQGQQPQQLQNILETLGRYKH
ncbi:hypothetical protein BGX38DRAFT_1271680 [Terfezia claveryi]|nr:hypothetical protein BGX38DRAFT_1271680 [Terfezia claveryi]